VVLVGRHGRTVVAPLDNGRIVGFNVFEIGWLRRSVAVTHLDDGRVVSFHMFQIGRHGRAVVAQLHFGGVVRFNVVLVGSCGDEREKWCQRIGVETTLSMNGSLVPNLLHCQFCSTAPAARHSRTSDANKRCSCLRWAMIASM